MRTFIAALAAAALLSLSVSSDASAQQGMRGPGGPARSFNAGPRMGTFNAGPRNFAAGPRNFAGPSNFGSPRFSGRHFGRHFAHGPRRHFRGRHAFVGLPLVAGAYAAYPYLYDDCVVPRRVWTDWGWRIRYVNVCDYY